MALFNNLNPLANLTPRFTEDQLAEMIEWFDEAAEPKLVVTEGEPPVKVVTVEKLLQFLELKKFHKRNFKYPSYMEIMTAVEKFTLLRVLTKEQFIYILDSWIKEPELKHELKLAFQVFDIEGRNILEIDEIATIVTEFGEPFNEPETREILRNANVRGDGDVHYEDFIESLFSVCPELYDLETEYVYENPDEDPSVPLDPEPEPEEPPPPSPPPKKGKKKK